MEKKECLKLLKGYLNLYKESVETLDSKLHHIEITKSRVYFERSNDSCIKALNDSLEKVRHNAIVEAFKKYADKDALEKYMLSEGNEYEKDLDGTLENWNAKVFFIFKKKDYDATMKYMKNHYKTRFSLFEIGDINSEYCIAYD